MDRLKYINQCVEFARSRGYTIATNIFFDPLLKRCCPIGAVWFARDERALPREYQQGFMLGFDNRLGSQSSKNSERARGIEEGKSYRAGFKNA